MTRDAYLAILALAIAITGTLVLRALRRTTYYESRSHEDE